MTTIIRARGPRELLAYVPYRLGFQPNESIVLIGLQAPRSRVGLVARVDVADLADPTYGSQRARALCSHLAADDAQRVVLVAYSNAIPRYAHSARWSPPGAAFGLGTGPVGGAQFGSAHGLWGGAGAEGGAFESPGGAAATALIRCRDVLECFWDTVDTWVVSGTGYWALGCTDDGCCPPAGRPLSDLDSAEISAHMVFAGASVANTRAEAMRITPAPEAAKRRATRAARRALSRYGELAQGITSDLGASDAAGGTPPSAADVPDAPGAADAQWRQAALATWRAALDQALVHGLMTEAGGATAPQGTALSGPVLGKIAAGLTVTTVRDAIMLTLVPGAGNLPDRTVMGGDVDEATREAMAAIIDPSCAVGPPEDLLRGARCVLEAVVAHTSAAFHAPALTLLGLIAWWNGDGSRACARFEAALEREPGHRLALLLQSACAAGIPPGWIRAGV